METDKCSKCGKSCFMRESPCEMGIDKEGKPFIVHYEIWKCMNCGYEVEERVN